MSRPKISVHLPITAEENVPEEPAGSWIELVQKKVQGLHFGVVQIVVHDSQVVQIESTERHRFDLRRSK